VGDVEAAVITMAEPFAKGLKFHALALCFTIAEKDPCTVPSATRNMTVITPCM
jgi:hypothetical protein